MAVLDPSCNQVVIRIVYDGPPEAGKTTSVRALATSFAGVTSTPEEDATGRTQWFDWMEYVGGRFEGSEIRCQIVTVPGQRALGARRRELLRTADAIVFVGDTSAARWPRTLTYLEELRQLRIDGVGAVGIVFQANKRDLPDAVGVADIRQQLGDARWTIGIVESVAADGTGIREAFVYAVRLALDRARDELAAGRLKTGTPAQVSPAELLAALRAAEAPPAASMEEALAIASPTVATALTSVAANLLGDVLAAEVDREWELEAASAEPEEPVRVALPLPPIPAVPPSKLAPRPPDASVPSGAIWPPVEGRTILLEVATVDLVPRRHTNGDWSAGLGTGWRLVSKRDAVFDSLDTGRNALVQWARLHAACTLIVSPHRCIVLAATGDGRWRLWQIVRAEESLRDLVERASSDAEAADLADSLCQTAHALVEVHARLADAPCDLPLTLDTIGACDASGMYIGLMPEMPVAPPGERRSPSAVVEAELAPLLVDRLRELEGALARRAPGDAQVAALLTNLRR
jgi:signal recognition particle receptor subunit beta|nr:ADP-ribosylation factor-like protein [Kofleriaceae bacterium]